MIQGFNTLSGSQRNSNNFDGLSASARAVHTVSIHGSFTSKKARSSRYGKIEGTTGTSLSKGEGRKAGYTGHG